VSLPRNTLSASVTKASPSASRLVSVAVRVTIIGMRSTWLLAFVGGVAIVGAGSPGCRSYETPLCGAGIDCCNGKPCEPPPPACDVDGDCAPGKYCILNECQSSGVTACKKGERPLISVTPRADSQVEFGAVMLNDTVERKVVVENMGDCNLNVESLGITDGSNPAFATVTVGTTFPKIVVPQRKISLLVRYTPTELKEAQGTLVVGSDDPTASIVQVALHGTYNGTPTLVFEPAELNFGYVPYAVGAGGQSRTNTIKLKNLGTGNAGVTITHAYLRNATSGFRVPVEIDSILPQSPKVLQSFDANSPSTWLDVNVTFAPTTNANLETYLDVFATAPNNPDILISALIKGSSLGPPAIAVTPLTLTLADPAGAPLSLGMTTFKQVTISNSGQSDLILDITMDDPTGGDFYISPSFLAPIAPGATAALGVFYTPTNPTDPLNINAPKVPARATVQIGSNDTAHALTKVNLEGWAKKDATDDVLKLELTFTNADNSWAGGDYRNVDIEVQSPLGMLCKKPTAGSYANTAGGWVPTTVSTPCDEWNKTTKEGHISWNASGTYEEPERVILFGLGATNSGKVFTVRVNYVEDCANIPTSTLSNLLGIGGSLIISAIGAWAGVPLAVSPDAIAKAIAGACFSHEGSTATVKVSLNGDQEIAAPQVLLRSKGDSAVIVKLMRESGTFKVVP